MGRSHALSGAAGWFAGCAGASALGFPPAVHVMVVGAAIAAGFALLPDIDHPDSTIAVSLGPVTQVVAWMVSAENRTPAAR